MSKQTESKRTKKLSKFSDLNSVIFNSKNSKNSVKNSLPVQRLGTRPELSARHHQDMVQAFGHFDQAGSGILQEDGAYRCIALTWRALGKDPTDKEIYALIGHLCRRDSKILTMDFKDYFRIVEKEMLRDEPPDEIRAMFQIISSTRDTTKPDMQTSSDMGTTATATTTTTRPTTRHITLENLKQISKELETDLTTDQLGAMISYADLDSSGFVSFQHFKKIMERPFIY